jgi:hypothetical protein
LGSSAEVSAPMPGSRHTRKSCFSNPSNEIDYAQCWPHCGASPAHSLEYYLAAGYRIAGPLRAGLPHRGFPRNAGKSWSERERTTARVSIRPSQEHRVWFAVVAEGRKIVRPYKCIVDDHRG